VNDWSADMAQLCKGAVVYVLADNDEPGRRVANIIQSDLQGIAKSAKVIVPVPDIPKADISDYFAAGHSKAEFESLLQQDGSVTEKSMDLMADKKYTFYVHTDANKAMIKDAVEKMFEGTKVAKVNTMNIPGKKRRRGAVMGQSAARKKAIVQLTEDSADIEIFSGL